MKISFYLSLVVLLILSEFVHAQNKHYQYQRKLEEFHLGWNKITLPDELFGKISKDFTDIRILGISSNQDTIEVPYILKLNKEVTKQQTVNSTVINTSQNELGHFVTFEIPNMETINQIKLNFKQQNFDWHIELEGSQNQQDWYTILDDYRILSIKNEWTNYQFTTLAIPNSNYTFYRIFVKSPKKPELINAHITRMETSEGRLRDYALHSITNKEDKKNKQTIIDLTLTSKVPVNYIKLNVNDQFDYYRPISIQYLSDSVHTEKGWHYNYQTVFSGTLNSIEKNIFKFEDAITQKIKILINNQDNTPLSIRTIEAKGYEYDLLARFSEQADYYLFYGNERAIKPQYDVDRFMNRIPDSLFSIQLGNEEKLLLVNDSNNVSPLFKNSMWLWIVIIIVIGLLGWATLKMIKKS